jgi:hypothetical protein
MPAFLSFRIHREVGAELEITAILEGDSFATRRLEYAPGAIVAEESVMSCSAESKRAERGDKIADVTPASTVALAFSTE